MNEMFSLPLEITFHQNEQNQSEFDDVAVYFSKEQWDFLKVEERELYMDVMMENYQILKSIGRINVKPTIVSKIERGEEPYVTGHCQPEEKGITNGCRRWNVPVRHHRSLSSSDQLVEEICVIQNFKGQSDISRNESNKCGREMMVVESNQGGHGDESNLNHVRQVVHKEENNMICSECGKCFSWNSFSGHKGTSTGEKPFECPECEKLLKSKSNLFQHQKFRNEANPFLCTECGKIFDRVAHLVRHKRIHTGEKPFECPECGKRFNVSANLATHRRIHTGEKPFACSECGRCFGLQSHLVRHQMTHTGRKPFSCSECGKCFTRKPHLVKHQTTHTRNLDTHQNTLRRDGVFINLGYVLLLT